MTVDAPNTRRRIRPRLGIGALIGWVHHLKPEFDVGDAVGGITQALERVGEHRHREAL
jgi:hypothetical protein